MRFHCGFSFNWKTIKKWIIPIIIGLIYLFFQEISVNALTLGDLEYKGQVDFGGSFNTNGANNEYTITFPNSFTNSNKYDYLLIPLSNSYLHRGLTSDSFDYEVFSISYRLISSNANWLLCQADNGYLLCPLQPSATYTGLSIRVPNSFANVVQDNFIFAFYSQYGYFYNSITEQQTQDIIDSQQQQTQDIIDSQQQQTQDIIDSNKVCTYYDKNSIVIDNYYLNALNQELASDQYGITDYLSISKSSLNFVNSYTSTTNANFCFYNINKSLISCTNIQNISGNVTIPSNSSFLRVSIRKNFNLPTFEICKNGNTAIADSITDSSLGSGTTGSAYFGDNIWLKNYGISSLLTIPIDLVNSISTKTCSPLVIDLPFMNNKSITLPCLSNLIETNFKQLFDLYQLIIGGIICYNCAIHIYRDIERAIDPDSDMSVSAFFV